MEPLSIEEIKRMLHVCYQCGTCASSCAAGMVNQAKNIRKLVQHIVSAPDAGFSEENDLLWFCATCYQCEDRCPEGVPLTTLLIQLRNMAAEKGSIPTFIQKEIDALRDNGFTYPPLESMLSRRRKLGLPDLPRPDGAEMETLLNLTRPQKPLSGEGERSA